jgi:class 3 adenylate cyclase
MPDNVSDEMDGAPGMTTARSPESAEHLTRLLAMVRECSRSDDLPQACEMLLRELVDVASAEAGIVLIPGEATGGAPVCVTTLADDKMNATDLQQEAQNQLSSPEDTLPAAPLQARRLWTFIECRPGARGVLGLCDSRPTASAEAEQLLASLAADQLAAATNHAYSRQALEAERKDLDRASFSLFALRHATRMLSSSVDLYRILAMSMDMLMELMQVKTAYVVLHEPSSPRFIALREGQGVPKGGSTIFFCTDLDQICVDWFVDHAEPVTRQEMCAGAANLERVASRLMIPHLPPAEVWVPLVSNQVVLGYVALAGKWSDEPFLPEELELLGTLADQISGAMENAEKSHARELFRRYVSEEVVEELLSKPDGLSLQGRRQEVTILFADIRDFSPYAEQHEPTAVVSHLNGYFERMGEIIFKWGGALSAYIGDAIMAIFGAPVPHADHARRAIEAAREMQREMVHAREQWEAEGLYPFRIGIGLHTGEVIVGDVGFERKMEYTAVGETVNVAYRLEQLTKSYPTTIIVSQDTLEQAGASEAAAVLDTVTVKGRTAPLDIYGVEPGEA